MKKIIILLGIFLIGYLTMTAQIFADCIYSTWSSVAANLSECLGDASVVQTGDSLELEKSWFSNTLQNWITNISIFLYIFAIGSIVYGGLMMTLSTGDDEKIKKAKDIVIWGIVGFLALISISAILKLIVSVIYWVGG